MLFKSIITLHRFAKMNNHAEERNQMCICLARIAKERYIKNKEKWKLGEKTQVKLDIFTMPNHIKRMFGDFLTPLNI